MQLTDHDRKILWAKAGNRCSYRFNNDVCDMELVKNDNGKLIVVGEECHIVGEKLRAARYIENYPERETYANAILMCRSHHKIIDDNEKIYTTEILLRMKNIHEEAIQQAKQNNLLPPLVIKDSEFLTIIEKAQKAVGMEINQPAQLSNVKSELRVKNAQEAIGFSTNQGLTSIIMSCSSCKSIFPAAFVGTPPEYVNCPRCGQRNKIPFNP